MKISHIINTILGIGLASSAFAQHATLPDFPNRTRTGVKFEHFSKERWQASNFAKAGDMTEWQDRRYGMFIHFGLTNKPEDGGISWGRMKPYAPDAAHMSNGKKRTEPFTTWTKDMKLEKFDADEWVAIAKRAGFKYIVVTTKHHEGFHMWDTAYSDFKITNTPFKRDYLKELTDACHKAKMPIGFYFAQREWYHPDYQPVDLSKVNLKGNQWTLKPGFKNSHGPRHAKYIEYQEKVIKELCTKYGKIDIWWWDAVSWGHMFTEDMWDSEKMTRMIRKLQPGIVINNRASIPGDFDTPEQHLGDFQDWRPWETCMSITKDWSYSRNPAKPLAQMIRLLSGASCGNGNLLASWGPRWNGAYDDAQIKRLYEVGDWLKLNGEAIYGTRGGPWKPTSWGGSTRKANKAYVHLYRDLENNLLVLPNITDRKLISAKLLVEGSKVEFDQNSKTIKLTIPEHKAINGALIVELAFDEDLDGLPSQTVKPLVCSFDADTTTYGNIVSHKAKVSTSTTSEWMPADKGASLVTPRSEEKAGAHFAFHTEAEPAPWVQIDLGKETNVTGVFVQNASIYRERAAGLTASISLDGKTWTKVWTAPKVSAHWEFPVSTLSSGAYIPGRKARYLRLQVISKNPKNYLLLKQVDVYGKE